MQKLSDKHIWLIAFFIFIVCRLATGNIIGQGTVLGILMVVLSVYWFIIPFLFGRDMRVPGYTFMMKKDEDKLVRTLFFALGLTTYGISIVV